MQRCSLSSERGVRKEKKEEEAEEKRRTKRKEEIEGPRRFRK
jgi:hypothetical protein